MSRFREEILEKCRAMKQEEASDRSKRIVENFLPTFQGKAGELRGLEVGLYRSLRQEVELSLLEEVLVEAGARLNYPWISDEVSKQIEFKSANPFDGTHWKKGSFGIQEPQAGRPDVDPESLKVVFVPGVVFGVSGERIGRGAGYYDRFLVRAPQALRIALAFDFQLVEKVTQKDWDQQVDWICTEERQILLPRALEWEL